MKVIRVYSGEDGESHFQTVELPYQRIADGLTGAGATAMRGASGIQFRRSPPGHYIDWHPAPARQYVIILQGQSKITVGDGNSHTFGTGDVLFADDITGRGHTTEVVGGEPRVSIFVPLTD